MFAALGEILFEVVGSPERLESVRDYDFAEHRVVEGRPRLQWVGNGLERLKLELMMHSSFSNPAAQVALLRATAAAHRALPLVFGNGGFRGFFVIDSLFVRSQQSSASGAPIAINVGLSLREWAAGSDLELATIPGLPVPGAIATATAATSGAAGKKAGVSALLRLQAATGATSPQLLANDVVAAAIVRSATR
jgi:phage protein U